MGFQHLTLILKKKLPQDGTNYLPEIFQWLKEKKKFKYKGQKYFNKQVEILPEKAL